MNNPESKQNFTSSFEGLLDLVRYLRSDAGCPWDREQSSRSLSPMLLEEIYELVSSIESENKIDLLEELGDVLLHIAFQIEIANTKNLFDMKDVFNAAISKYVTRHPHVFADESYESTEELKQRWEELKRKEKEKERNYILDGIPSNQPSLSHAQILQSRASRAGFDWENIIGVREKINEELNELENTKNKSDRIEEFGDLIFTLVNYGRKLNIDVEQAVRLANTKFISRFVAMEILAEQRDQEFISLTIEQKDELWETVKNNQ
ncbi:MAG: nucleoside triphosphate pyrophosphohydrolase [Chloroflexi bacterium]|nr:nucleoside triphosphate pyrophosphohydrolase [Chloroflexota bacterium]